MITTGAASDTTYKLGYSSVFQTYTPASRYLTGAIDLLTHLDPDLRKIAFVYENAAFAANVVEAARTYAEGLGFEIVLLESYDPDTINFQPIIDNIQESEAEAILGGGHLQDGSSLAQQIYQNQLEINFLTLLVAPPEPDFADLGDAALGVTGPSQWEPSVSFGPESVDGTDVEWFGPLGDAFVQAYENAYNQEPSYHSIGGYAAGMILEKAILEADSTEVLAIKAALDDMDILTCYGRIKFDTSEETHGLQIGHDMVYVQWQNDHAGSLVKQVVWPLEGATAEAIYPISEPQ
jgi:branched-chain amino acid transport system substrate-binding protein